MIGQRLNVAFTVAVVPKRGAGDAELIPRALGAASKRLLELSASDASTPWRHKDCVFNDSTERVRKHKTHRYSYVIRRIIFTWLHHDIAMSPLKFFKLIDKSAPMSVVPTSLGARKANRIRLRMTFG